MAASLDMLPTLSETLKRHGIAAQKRLGQHFLLDGNLTARIAREAGNLAGVHVIEIGPGPGGLTRALLEAGAESVIAVEKDTECLGALHELEAAGGGRLKIISADALETDITTLAPPPRKIVANLPYNVATPLLFQWLGLVHRDPAAVQRMTLMFQKEVAMRIVARPGGKDYGRLAVMSQWLCEAEYGFDLPPGAFHPPPKVHSSVISLTPRQMPLHPARRESLEAVLKGAFGQRRKMLRRALKVLGVDGAALCEAACIDPSARAETLSIGEFCALANAFDECRKTP